MGGVCGGYGFVGDGAMGLVAINRIGCVEDVIQKEGGGDKNKKTPLGA